MVIEPIVTQVKTGSMIKMTLSQPKIDAMYQKVTMTWIEKEKKYHVEKFSKTQVFHDNLTLDEILDFLEKLVGNYYKQWNGWSITHSFQARISKKGKLLWHHQRLSTPIAVPYEQNREKRYLLEEGMKIAPLIDLGVLTQEGKIVKKYFDKFKQINRFIELFDHALEGIEKRTLHIVDFGCGKSYLTFVLYFYLTEIKGWSVEMVGLDLKSDVIAFCQETAQKYGYKTLTFKQGDIASYQVTKPVDAVITLHACDTATDIAIAHAIKWNSELIFSIPCCQHEMNSQWKDSEDFFGHYGIIKERFCALATDTLRGHLLEYMGYQTQLIEFVDLAHSPKNILIRARRERKKSLEKQEKLRHVIDSFLKHYPWQSTLYNLLTKGKNDKSS